MVFTKDTKIREITKHHSFRGFGHLFHIYDEDEMVKYPSKRETGLFLALSQRGLQCLCSDLSPQTGIRFGVVLPAWLLVNIQVTHLFPEMMHQLMLIVALTIGLLTGR